MRTIDLTTTPRVEVISAYTAPNQQVPAVDAESAWWAIGSFYVPVTARARLEVVGLLSSDSLAMQVRLFDMTAAAVVSGTQVELDATNDQRALSGAVEVTGGHTYQFQAQVLAASGFGVVKSATLV